MARPKKDTPEGKKALEKWKATMMKKYGTEEEMRRQFSKIGAEGGKNGHTGGFASRPDIARIAGAKGGSISRRGFSYNKDWEKHKEEIMKMKNRGESVAEISRHFGLPYSMLLIRIKKELGV